VPWDAADDYDLRNTPAHLAARARWDDLGEVAFDTGYLRAALRRLGLPGLTAVLSELAAVPAMGAPLRSDLVRLRDLLAAEAPFLSAGQYAGYDGPFCNHLALMWSLDDREAPPPLWCDLADVDQEGWLSLVGQRGNQVRRATRYFMPGERRTHSFGTYESGPVGVEARMAVDARRLRLLGETVDVHLSVFGYEPRRYHWRIWDLRTGALIFERSDPSHLPDGMTSVAVPELGEDWSYRGRPAAFTDPDLVRETSYEPPRGYRPPRVVTARLKRFARLEKSANSDHVAFFGEDDEGRLRVVVTDARRRRIVTDDPVVPRKVVLVEVGGRLALLGIGQDDHLYRFDLGGGPAADFGEVPPPPAPPAAVVRADWDSRDRRWRFRLVPANGGPAIALSEPAQGQDSDIQNAFRAGSVESSGRFAIALKDTAIGVWRYPGGQWAGHLAAAAQGIMYGGVLEGGYAVSPDGDHLISSYGKVLVWNLSELNDGKDARPWAPFQAPHWKLEDVELPGRLAALSFFWGGRLVAAATEEHELLVLRFWRDSAILARVGLPHAVTRLHGEAYGPAVTCVGPDEQATVYRFRFLPKPHVTQLAGPTLALRLQRPAARSVDVAGTFTGWRPRPLERGAHGVWHRDFELPAGDHEYKYLIDGAAWDLDPHVPFRPGPVATNSYVTVRPEGRPRLARAVSAMASWNSASPSSWSRKSAKDRW
jgi:hypothetical protein